MDLYTIWADKEGDISDLEWVNGMRSFFDHLISEGRMESYRITRCKMGFRSIADMPEWMIIMSSGTWAKWIRHSVEWHRWKENWKTNTVVSTNLCQATYNTPCSEIGPISSSTIVLLDYKSPICYNKACLKQPNTPTKRCVRETQVLFLP